MSLAAVSVETGSRLHFGLLSFGVEQGRNYGGLGLMIDSPQCVMRIEEADSLRIEGKLAARISEIVKFWTAFRSVPEPNCLIRLIDCPTLHSGLGVGTQLALGLAAGLDAWHGNARGEPPDLAACVGRGQRSAIGTYGFCHGGLLFERGKASAESLSPLDARLDFPQEWRLVLITPEGREGLHGRPEREAFQRLPPVSAKVRQELENLAEQQLLPAVRREAFVEFSEALFQFGRLSGSCFSAIQGGPYNGEVLSQLVAQLRDWGISGVGQSSWGPTIYAITPTELAATDLVKKLKSLPELTRAQVHSTIALNRGARISSVAR